MTSNNRQIRCCIEYFLVFSHFSSLFPNQTHEKYRSIFFGETVKRRTIQRNKRMIISRRNQAKKTYTFKLCCIRAIPSTMSDDPCCLTFRVVVLAAALILGIVELITSNKASCELSSASATTSQFCTPLVGPGSSAQNPSQFWCCSTDQKLGTVFVTIGLLCLCVVDFFDAYHEYQQRKKKEDKQTAKAAPQQQPEPTV